MLRTVCDICGEIIPPSNSVYKFTRKGCFLSEELDVCNDCLNRIMHEAKMTKEGGKCQEVEREETK